MSEPNSAHSFSEGYELDAEEHLDASVGSWSTDPPTEPGYYWVTLDDIGATGWSGPIARPEAQ